MVVPTVTVTLTVTLAQTVTLTVTLTSALSLRCQVRLVNVQNHRSIFWVPPQEVDLRHFKRGLLGVRLYIIMVIVMASSSHG